MAIAKLKLLAFRNLAAVELDFASQGITVIHGKNGSGKTSLLEALSIISCGRSFRTNQQDRLIQDNQQQLVIYAELETQASPYVTTSVKTIPLGLSRDRKERFTIKLAGEAAGFADLSLLFPSRIITPVEASALINASPDKRRSFLDWGVFHVKHEYWQLIKQLNKIIKQKNAALKARCSQTELNEWNKQFVKLALLINQERANYFYAWQIELEKILSQYQIFNELKITYNNGWSDNEFITGENINIEKLLAWLNNTVSKKERDIGYCAVGPQRADIVLGQEQFAKEQLSRGQQKLLAIAMYLAQGELLKKTKGYYPVYLIDDFTSELDSDSQDLLLSMLKSKPRQVIITALDINHPALQALIGQEDSAESTKVYSITNGQIKKHN